MASVPSRASGAQFEIWQAGGRIHSVDNPVRIEILAALEGKPRTLNDLVSLTGKAKSTLSAIHVQGLLQSGLVEEAVDPNDARVKWYKLVGSRLGASNVEKPDLRDAVLHFVQSSGLIPLGPLLEVLDVRDLVDATSVPKYADGVAKRLGNLVGRMLMAQEPKDAARELTKLLEAANLGKVEWKGTSPKVGARATPLERFTKLAADEAMRTWRQRVAQAQH